MIELTIVISNLVLNVATVYGVVVASMHFEKPAILWFLLLPFLNGLEYRSRPKGNGDKTNAA